METDENVFLQHHEKLWKSKKQAQRNTNKHKKMKCNLDNHTDTLITSEKLEKKTLKSNET
jgi:hypothetical protein